MDFGIRSNQPTQASTEVTNEEVQTPDRDDAGQLQQAQTSSTERPGVGLEERRSEMRLQEQATRTNLEDRLPGRVPQGTYSEIREQLSTGFLDWVTEDERRTVHQQLDTLAPADYRATLGKMEQDGLLSRYLDGMDPTERTSFLRQAADNGYIQRSPGDPDPSGRFNPPAAPPMLVNQRGLPASVGNAIHEHNIGMAERYNERYGAYLERYNEAVMQAPSGAAIRQIGAPVRRVTLSEPGVLANHPDSERLSVDWYEQVNRHAPSDLDAYEAISDRIHDLSGMRRPGDVWLRFQVSGNYRHAGDHGNVGVQLEGRLSSEQGLEGQTQGTSQASAGPVRLGGNVQEGGGSTSFGLETNRGFGGSRTSGTGLQVDSEGNVEATLGTTRNAGSYGTYNPSRAEVESGARAVFETDNFSGEVRAGIGMRGITEAEARAAIEGPGVFGTPSELNAGTRWDDLPESQREMYVILGWTRNEWNNNTH